METCKSDQYKPTADGPTQHSNRGQPGHGRCQQQGKEGSAVNRTEFVVVLVSEVMAAAILCFVVVAQAAPTGDGPRVVDAAVETKVGVDHLDWLDDICQKVEVSKVDASAPHRG